MLLKVRPESAGVTLKPKSGKSLVFCAPALVLVTVTTKALELLTPNCVRLLVTLNNGAAGRMVRPTLVLVVAPAALDTTTVTIALVASVGLVEPAVPTKPLVLVKAMPAGRLEEVTNIGNSETFCPAPLVTVITSALGLLIANWVRLLVAENSGRAGRTVTVRLVVAVPPAFAAVSCTLVNVPACAGLVPPRSATSPLVVVLVEVTPIPKGTVPPRLKLMGKKLVNRALVLVAATRIPLEKETPYWKVLLLRTERAGPAGRMVRSKGCDTAPPALVAVTVMLENIPAVMGVPLMVALKLLVFVVRISPAGKLELTE